MGEKRYLLRWFLYGVLFEIASGATGHVNVEFEILQLDNPTGTSYNGSDLHSQRKCCDIDTQKENCPAQCDTTFVICLGGLSSRGCAGPIYSHTTPKLEDTNLYTTTHDNRLAFTFTWNQWHSGDIDYIVDVMDYDTSNRQDLIDNFTLTTSLNVSANYEQTKEQRFSLRGYASLDFSIRVWCQDGYKGADCSQQCLPHDAFHVCGNHQTAELIPTCKDQDVLMIRIPPSPAGATYNYSPERIQQRVFDFVSKEICPDATSLEVNIIRFSLSRSIEFKATCDGTPVDNLLFTTHLYVMSLARKTQLRLYFPSLTVPVVKQKTGSGAHLYMMLEVVSYEDSSNNCSAGHTCSVQINICTRRISNTNACTQYPMISGSAFKGGNLTICDGKAVSGTSYKYLISSVTWPISDASMSRIWNDMVQMLSFPIVWPDRGVARLTIPECFKPEYNKVMSSIDCFDCFDCFDISSEQHVISTDIKSNRKTVVSQHNKAIPTTYAAGHTYDKAMPYEMTLSDSTHRLAIKLLIWCANGYSGDRCEHQCQASGDRECDKDGHAVCKSGYHGSSCTDINECSGSLCKNGGTCQNTAGSFTCTCPSEWAGPTCETDIDECSMNYCGSSATSCTNTPGGYSCTCESHSFNAHTCSDRAECNARPCKNGGTCYNLYGSYHCSCTDGFNGSRCTDDIDECQLQVCGTHSTSCVNTVGSYNCTCKAGWTGKSCQDDINECTSKPCKYGGRCHNTPGSYHCSCVAGSKGTHCDDIDECKSDNTCHNNGTCINLTPPNRYRCQCPPGWTDKSCQTDINECTSKPCKFGTCNNSPGSYHCVCLVGSRGTYCDDTNECSSSHNPCQNQGTCVNLTPPQRFRCECPPGLDPATRCLHDIDECKADVPPCVHGTCNNTDRNYTCSCNDGWYGRNCSEDVNECHKYANICQNKGICVNTDGGYTCKCVSGWSGHNCTADVNECTTSNPCKNLATCDNTVGGYRCECATEWSGTNCSKDVDECHTIHPCKNHATCKNTQGSYRCLCSHGWSGTNCTSDIDECKTHNPCMNYASCHNTNGGYTCACVGGWTGTNCDSDIDECTTVLSCKNHATCHNNNGGYTCACSEGWNGTNCDNDIDECTTIHPCKNNATCHDTDGSYACTCSGGWNGTNCDNDIDECHSVNPCRNGGTCRNTPGGYSCKCINGWTGTDCTNDIDECAPLHPCQHSAPCKNLDGGYSCTCTKGRSGQNCSLDINECQTIKPCMNNATCHNTNGGYTCACSGGWNGTNCDNDIDECASLHPCQHSAPCKNIDGGYRCTCTKGWSGQNCSVDINECQTIQPCMNHATCHNNDGDYTCSCLKGWSGDNCSKDIDECHDTNDLCQYGTCINTAGSYNCSCQTGWSGSSCQNHLDECLTNPCKNKGTCSNLHDSYHCTCPSNWSGHDCTTDIDECRTNQCTHGNCSNTQGSYRCACENGWTGSNCRSDINECQLNLDNCHHNSTCVNTPGGFSCTCTQGWTDSSCTTDINECQTLHPCGNHGTCKNVQGGYNCSCSHGWSGTNCNHDINECDTLNPCKNQATCNNILGGYTCLCADGWTDFNCTGDINECDSVNLCQNNGTCTNIGGSYTCACLSGWNGRNCETDVNECLSNPCKNGGTCLNSYGSFNCNCIDHWGGRLCALDVDECKSESACTHGKCNNFLGGYNCTCSAGWTGLKCDISTSTTTSTTASTKSESTVIVTTKEDKTTKTSPTPVKVYTQEPTSMMETTMLPNTSALNTCSQSPCYNNGTCVNQGFDYVCNCTNKWTGRNCTDDVDECTTDICAGKGVCINTVGSYSCKHLGEAIYPACTGSSWNITANMTILKEMYPTITSNHVFFGDNSCQGIEKGSLLLFQQGLQECLTSKRVSDGTLFYENILYYAIYDPINPFIIRQHKWTFTVECDVSTNEATSSHVHHETNSEHVTVTGHHPISMAFYTDPNFQHEKPGNPIHASIGSDVYVKVYTEEPDWTVKMRLHTCFTKPNSNADDTMIYYIIKDGCEVDSNTHIMSQSTHETKFVFQDFEYLTNREGLDISCNATFCETKDFSPGCAQACRNLGG